MDKLTRDILCELQDGFKLETRPFMRIAKSVGHTEKDVIDVIKKNLDNGVIRRIGVAIRPEHLGHKKNALVAWKIAPDKVDHVGSQLALIKEISHCYDRQTPDGWDYNLFTMIHAVDQAEFDTLIKKIKRDYSIADDEYQIFPTLRELKKTSVKYFTRDSQS